MFPERTNSNVCLDQTLPGPLRKKSSQTIPVVWQTQSVCQRAGVQSLRGAKVASKSIYWQRVRVRLAAMKGSPQREGENCRACSAGMPWLSSGQGFLRTPRSRPRWGAVERGTCDAGLHEGLVWAGRWPRRSDCATDEPRKANRAADLNRRPGGWQTDCPR